MSTLLLVEGADEVAITRLLLAKIEHAKHAS